MVASFLLTFALLAALAGCGTNDTTTTPTTVPGPAGPTGGNGPAGPAGSPAPTSPLSFVFNFVVAPMASLDFSTLALPGVTFTYTTNASGGTLTAAGKYTAGPHGNTTDVVTASDANGNTATINIEVGPVITISPASGAVSPGGHITFIATGGSGTGYTWTKQTDASGMTLGASDGTYTAGPASGTDTIKVTDSLGNTDTANIVVGSAIHLTGGTVPPKGTLTLAATGGAGHYLYALTGNLSGGHIDALTGVYVAGSHGSVTDVVTVIDSNFQGTTANVNVGAGLTITPAPPSPSLNIAPGGAITFVASGGCNSNTTPPCGTYTWTLSTNASHAPNLPAPTTTTATGDTIAYKAGSVGPSVDMIQCTDSLGNTAQVPISVGSSLTIDSSPENTHNVLSGACLQLSATGGLSNTTGHTYHWSIETNLSGGTNGAPASVLAPDASQDGVSVVYCSGNQVSATDIVEVTDDNGNEAFYAITVGQPLTVIPGPSLSLPPNSDCNASRDQTFQAQGGVPNVNSPFGYDWEIEFGAGLIDGLSSETNVITVHYQLQGQCAPNRPAGLTRIDLSDNPLPVGNRTPLPHTVVIRIGH